MKKYLLFFTLPLLVACNCKSPKEATIAGKISNYSGSVAYLMSKSVVDTIHLTDGAFVFKKTITEPQMFTMRMARNRFNLYLIPGDSSYVEYSFSDPKPVFSGDNAQFLNSIRGLDAEIGNVMKQWRDVYTLGFSDFNSRIDSLKLKLFASLDTVKGEVKNAVDLESSRIEYGLLKLRLNYPQMNAYVSQAEFDADKADYSMLDSFNPNIAAHLMFSDYCEIVNQYVGIKLEKIEEYKTVKDADAEVRLPVTFKLIDSLIITDPVVRDFVKMNMLNEEVSYGKFYTLGDVVNSYVASCSVAEYANSIKKTFSEKMKIAPGEIAPAIVGQTTDGKTVTLESFRGSLVYVDFWATWCGPCRGELPYLETLQDDYKGKNIVFISLSVDDDEDAWLKMVKEKKMKGVQLHAKGAWNSDAAKGYQVKAIPTFVLISADGHLITPAAPRPSDEAVRALFDAELAKL